MSHSLTDKNLDGLRLRVVFAILIFCAMSGSATFGAGGFAVQEPTVFAKCWEFTIIPDLAISPAADASAVYVLDHENKLHGVDLATGRSLWSSEVGGEVISNLLVLGDAVLLVTNSQSGVPNSSAKTVVRSLSSQTGITQWQTVTTSSPAAWLGAVTGNVVAVGSNGAISAVARLDGKVVWQTDLPSGVTSQPHFHQRGVALATASHEVLRISGATGSVQVVWKSQHLPTAILSDAGGRLVVGDERGNLILVSTEGDKEWRFRNGAQISSVLPHDSEYLAASHDNFVYKFSRSGNVKWKRRLPGRAGDEPLVLGDTAVVPIVGTGSVYTLDLENGKILNRIETGDEVSLRIAGLGDGQGFIVAGPHALLYFSRKCPAK